MCLELDMFHDKCFISSCACALQFSVFFLFDETPLVYYSVHGILGAEHPQEGQKRWQRCMRSWLMYKWSRGNSQMQCKNIVMHLDFLQIAIHHRPVHVLGSFSNSRSHFKCRFDRRTHPLCFSLVWSSTFGKPISHLPLSQYGSMKLKYTLCLHNYGIHNVDDAYCWFVQCDVFHSALSPNESMI